MTPTLFGRWQIRLFLLPTVGLIISLLVGLVYHRNFLPPLWALLYVLVFGLVWDIPYQFMTTFRWDRDWPTSFQVAAGVIEGALIWVLIITVHLPGIPSTLPFPVFLIQYGLIWLSIFLLLQGPLRLFFLSWRYQGGQWLITRARGVSQAPAVPYSAQQQQVGVANPLEPPRVAPAFAGAQPQFAGPNPVPYAVQQPVQFAGPNPAQFAGPQAAQFVSPGPAAFDAQQTLRATGPSPAHIPAEQTVRATANQPAQPYVCACGFTSERSAGNFCPNCGRPKV
jgi:hypothetical protein